MITSFTKLSADLQEYLEDEGPEFIAALPTIINKAHLLVSRAMNLDIFVKEHGLTTTVGQKFIDLTAISPLRVNSLIYPTGRFVERRSQAYVRMHGGLGRPRYFCDRNEVMIDVTPVPDASYPVLVTYLTRPDDLSTTNETSWFTQHVPDLLQLACLVEACRFLKNPTRAAEYEKDMAGAFTLALRDHANMIHTEGM